MKKIILTAAILFSIYPISRQTSAQTPSYRDPYITLSAYYALPGQAFRVNGSGFLPGETVTINTLGRTQALKASRSGTIASQTFTVPFSAINSTQTVQATGSADFRPVNATLNVGTFYPFAEPSTYFVKPGGKFKISATRFAPNEQVTLTGPGLQKTLKATGTGQLTTTVTAPNQEDNFSYTLTGVQSATASSFVITVSRWQTHND
jgi:hypothetical protein